MMENTINMMSSSSKKPIEKKPFLKRGSRKEPSALHRINKDKEKGVVSPPQLSASYSSSPSSSNAQFVTDSGLTEKEWDASWATSSTPTSTSFKGGGRGDIPPAQLYSASSSSASRFDPSSNSSAMHGFSNHGKVRNSDEYVDGLPTNLGKVRNSNEFESTNTTIEYSNAAASHNRQTRVDDDNGLSGDMDMDRTHSSSDTSGDNINGNMYSPLTSGHRRSIQGGDRVITCQDGGMDELEEFAELEKALEEIDSPEPTFYRAHDNDNSCNTDNDYDKVDLSRTNGAFMQSGQDQAHGGVEKSILKSSSQSLPIHTAMSGMFGGQSSKVDKEEASSTEYTPVEGFDQYISGAAVRSKTTLQQGYQPDRQPDQGDDDDDYYQQQQRQEEEKEEYQVSEFDLHKIRRTDYISSDDEGQSPNESSISQAQFVPTSEDTSLSKHQNKTHAAHKRQSSPSCWGPSVSYLSQHSNFSATRPNVANIISSSSHEDAIGGDKAWAHSEHDYDNNDNVDVEMIDVGTRYHDINNSNDNTVSSQRRDEFSYWEARGSVDHGNAINTTTTMRTSYGGDSGNGGSYYNQYEHHHGERDNRDYDDYFENGSQGSSDTISQVPSNSSYRSTSTTRPIQPVVRSRPRIGKKIPQPPKGSMSASTVNVKGISPNRQQPSQTSPSSSSRSGHTPLQRADSPGTLAANLSEKAKELEAELELYRSENAALRKSRIHQENTLADMKQQQSEIAKWSAEERKKTEEYCEEQRQAAARERRTAAKQAREQREREQISTRKDRQEIENLQNTVEKLKSDLEKSNRKGKATERRLTQGLKDSNEEREQLEKTVLSLEQEKVDIWNLLETFTQDGINVVNPLRKKLAQLRAKRNAQKQQSNMNADDVRKARKALQTTSCEQQNVTNQQRGATRQSKHPHYCRAPGSSYVEEVVIDDPDAYGYHGTYTLNTQVNTNEVIESTIPSDMPSNAPKTSAAHDHDYHHTSTQQQPELLQRRHEQTQEFQINSDFLPKSVAFEPPAASITPVISTVYQPSTNGPSRDRLSIEGIEGNGADMGRALSLNFSESHDIIQESSTYQQQHAISNSNSAYNSQRSSRGSRYSDSQDDCDNFDLRVAAATAKTGRVDGVNDTLNSNGTPGCSQQLQERQQQAQYQQQAQIQKQQQLAQMQRQQQQQQQPSMMERQNPTSSTRQEVGSAGTSNLASIPSSQPLSTQAPGSGMQPSNANTARSIETTPDGGKIVKYRNGTVKEIKPNGTIDVRFMNGDIKRTMPDKKVVVYYYKEANTKHTTFEDGLEIYEFPNGQVEKHSSDGRKEICFPDGTRKFIHATGMQESLFPDGHIVREYENDETGYREIVTPDGQVVQEFVN